jgi:predicted nucleotidyltransferase
MAPQAPGVHVAVRAPAPTTVVPSAPTLSTAELFRQGALATLSYHDLLDLPLTAVEVWRYLIRPRGVDLPVPALSTVERALDDLVASGRVETMSGYFTLPQRAALIQERLDRHARAQEKWARLRRIVYWLQAVPFVRMVAGSGSLARESVREESDLDVLIVASPGRIWTVRFFVTALLDVFRLRRRPTGPTRDLVCLNHYLTLDRLELPYQSLYTAYEYARLVPLVGEDVCRRFRGANRQWMERFVLQVLPDVASHGKVVRPSRVLSALQRVGEVLLRGMLGTGLERLSGSFQSRRIARGAEEAAAGRVVASAVHLEFHPRSHEAPLLAAFNARMDVLGLGAFGGQKDSGLA